MNLAGARRATSRAVRTHPGLAVAAAAVMVAIVTWVFLWTTVRPRTGYDGLVYHRLAFGYAGASVEEQIEDSYTIFRRYADPDVIAEVEGALSRGGTVWSPWLPTRDRWLGIYSSRPLYPLVVAALYPVLDVRAPVAAGAVVVLIFTLAVLVGLRPLIGSAAAAVAYGLCIMNVDFSRWLVTLHTDGLSIALWALALAVVARFVAVPRTRRASAVWLAGLFLVAVALAFTRPLGMFLPVAVGLSAALAFPFDRRIAERFVASTAVVSLAAAVFVIYAQVAGLPSFRDVLQDLPTRHFARPDIADPLAFVVQANLHQIPNVLLPAFVGDPRLWGSALLGLAGVVVVGRAWWAAPFVVAPLAVHLSYMVHPGIEQYPRNMAASWLSLNVGIALLVVAAIERLRRLDDALIARV